MSEFYQTFTEELISILLKLLKKEENASKLIVQGWHYFDIRQKYHKRRKIQVNIPNEHRCKNSQQNISKLNSATH